MEKNLEILDKILADLQPGWFTHQVPKRIHRELSGFYDCIGKFGDVLGAPNGIFLKIPIKHYSGNDESFHRIGLCFMNLGRCSKDGATSGRQ